MVSKGKGESILEIRQVTDGKEKGTIVHGILSSLPEWFGIPESTQEYIEQSQAMPFAAAFEGDSAVGFVALKETSLSTLEIYVMGVLPSLHRAGVGKALFDWAYGYAREGRYDFLQVKTLDASAHNAEYDRTRAYYLAMGFKPLECFPTLWGESIPCLLLVMAVCPSS
jgi:GNAT superfamily N-acetyltransferase